MYFQNNNNRLDGKRVSKTPNRLGVDRTNKDHFFESNESLNVIDDSDVSMKSIDCESESDDGGSVSFRDNGFPKQNVSDTQILRIEAKVNQIHKVLLHVQRMMMSLAAGSNNVIMSELVTEYPDLPEMPLKSVDSLENFEKDLSTSSYRKQAVSLCGHWSYFILQIISR